MLRFIRRRFFLILLVIAAVAVLKFGCVKVKSTVSGWISGTKENRVSKAVTSMVGALSDGESVKGAVEVFRESIENSETN